MATSFNETAFSSDEPKMKQGTDNEEFSERDISR
jgi:hypothetical protein